MGYILKTIMVFNTDMWFYNSVPYLTNGSLTLSYELCQCNAVLKMQKLKARETKSLVWIWRPGIIALTSVAYSPSLLNSTEAPPWV